MYFQFHVRILIGGIGDDYCGVSIHLQARFLIWLHQQWRMRSAINGRQVNLEGIGRNVFQIDAKCPMLVVAQHKTILWANSGSGSQRTKYATGDHKKCTKTTDQGDNDLFHKWMD